MDGVEPVHSAERQSLMEALRSVRRWRFGVGRWPWLWSGTGWIGVSAGGRDRCNAHTVVCWQMTSPERDDRDSCAYMHFTVLHTKPPPLISPPPPHPLLSRTHPSTHPHRIWHETACMIQRPLCLGSSVSNGQQFDMLSFPFVLFLTVNAHTLRFYTHRHTQSREWQMTLPLTLVL